MSGKWEVAGKSKKVAPISKKALKKQKKELPTAEDVDGGESFPMASKFVRYFVISGIKLLILLSFSDPLKESTNIFNLIEDESDLPVKEEKSENKENNIITKPRVSSAKPKPKKKSSPVAQNKREERQILLEQLDAVSFIVS